MKDSKFKEVTDLFFSKKYSEMTEEEQSIINRFMPNGGFKTLFHLAMNGSEADREKMDSFSDEIEKISKEKYIVRFTSGRSVHNVRIHQVFENLKCYHEKIGNDVVTNECEGITDMSQTKNWYFGSQEQKQELAEIVKLLTEY